MLDSQGSVAASKLAALQEEYEEKFEDQSLDKRKKIGKCKTLLGTGNISIYISHPIPTVLKKMIWTGFPKRR